MPISESLMRYWGSHLETDPIKKAVRFLMLSNFGYMGKPRTLRLGKFNTKQIILNRVDQTFERIKFCQFTCVDFRTVLGKIVFRDETHNDRIFIYADPPYLNTTNNYKQGFTEQDTIDLFELLVESGIKFAISEFDNEFVTGLANDYNLNIITIGDRKNMKNRRTEILVTNYKNPLSLFD
jgi:DNA adenine methylase